MSNFCKLLTFACVVTMGCAGASADHGKPDRPQARATVPAFDVRVVGSGRPMILIPGLTCSGDVWNTTVKHFGEKYQAHVLTLAGFAGQPAVDGPFLDRVRRELVEYIKRNRLERPVIVGHSLGGFLAFWIAATAPDLVGPVIAVDGVPFLPALMDPAVTVETSRSNAGQMRDMMAGMTAEQFAVQNRMSLSSMIKEPRNVDLVAKNSEKSDPRAVGRAVYDLMTIDLRPMLNKIRVPVLLVAAAEYAKDEKSQTVVRDRYESQVSTVPDHRVILASEARHFVMLDDPKFLFSEMDAFLSQAVTRK
jgi:pimeloyl-ACP methyl ester carboxylesterase